MAPSASTIGDAGVDDAGVGLEQDATGCVGTARRSSAPVSEIDDEPAQHDVERRSVPNRNRGWGYRMNHAVGSDASRLDRPMVTNPGSCEPPGPVVAWSDDPTGDERFTVVVRTLTPRAGKDRVQALATGEDRLPTTKEPT